MGHSKGSAADYICFHVPDIYQPGEKEKSSYASL